MSQTITKQTEEYLNILSPNELIFFKKLILDIKTNPIYTQRNAETLLSKLMRYIKSSPYPVLQILQDTTIRSSPLVENSVYCTLQTFVENDFKSSASKQIPNEFFNFLANFQLFTTLMVQVRLRLLPDIISIYNDHLYMALLARDDPTLLDDVIRLKTQSPSVAAVFPSKECILQEALINSQHFVVCATQRQKHFNDIRDVATRNNLIILKISNEFANPSQTIDEIGNLGRMLDSFSISADVPSDVEEIQKFFYADFQRLRTSIDFLRRFVEPAAAIPIRALIESNGILQTLYEHKNIMLIGYDETRKLIETNNHWESQMPAVRKIRDQELETLTYFFALATIYDMIVAKMCTDAFATAKISKLNTMMRQVRSVDTLCSLIEDIFQLVFLRWEHLYSQRRPSAHLTTFDATHRSKSTKSGAETSSTTDVETPSPVVAPTMTTSTSLATKHGFICRGRALRAIFMFLKNFVTKKLHSEEYKNSSERIQMRFTRIFDIITEALWKYAVLEKIIDSDSDASVDSRLLDAEDLLQLVQFHADVVEKTSSDDESKERSNYASLTRRKAAKKKRRATFSGGLGPVTLEGLGEKGTLKAFNNKPDNEEEATTALKIRTLLSHCLDHSIIPKMLGTPENLAIMALAMKNFNDVKYIIQSFNLHNTELDRELAFVEQQQQVKLKLATIYESYKLQEEISASSTNHATVEQIKKVVAKGFEASKLISIVDNFAQSKTIDQSEEMQQMLEKHISTHQYPFLQQYTEPNLQAVIVADLILNLSFNYDITSNILMVIRRMANNRLQTQPKNVATTTTMTAKEESMAKSNLPRDIGCTPLLENLCECMHLQQVSLKEILCDNFHSLKPRKLAAELQREKNFAAVFYKTANEIGRCDDLKSLANRFVDLKSKSNYYARFIAYVANLRRLLQLRDRNLEIHTSKLLKFDPSDIIGELIFEDNMTPLEIEGNVSALNLNMVHMIALNICPEICGGGDGIASKDTIRRRRSSPAAKSKHKSIFNYISNQNGLLGFLLQRINSADAEELTPEVAVPIATITMNDEYLHRFLQLPEIVTLSEIYAGNTFIAALRSDRLDVDRVRKLSSQLTQLNILMAFANAGGCDVPQMNAEKDRLIVNLIAENTKFVYLADRLSDIAKRASLMQENFTKVESSRMAKDLIESILHHREAVAKIDMQLRAQLEHTLDDITIYSKVSEVLQFESWPQAYDFGMKTPNTILEKLLRGGCYKLCYDWCQVLQLAKRFAHQTRSFFATFLDVLSCITADENVDIYLLRIVETFPTLECVHFYDAHKDKFRSVALLNYAVDFLAKNTKPSSLMMTYKNYKVSLKIFEQLTKGERDQFWNLLRHPLLIIEQLIMNAKFEILSKVLAVVRPMLVVTAGAPMPEDTTTTTTQCRFCFDKRGNIYDVHSKGSSSAHFTLGSSDNRSSAFILLNFNLYQTDHIITMECVDLLLRIYATKALDFHISEVYSSSERVSQSTDMASLDSLCGAFLMPKAPPARDEWVKDDDAVHCMCCRRAVFTMLMRRHHCRRCGRVVCFACSTNRMQIPELYEEVEVRICNDCHRQTAVVAVAESSKPSMATESNQTIDDSGVGSGGDRIRWQLSGNITHDKLLREEFCYEHAPSVALSLSILSYHHGSKKCVDLLLYHCRKLEKLLVPNPEVDYELIAKMMNCLALAAKVRGGPPEVETIREHSDIIMSVVQNGCETLIPAGPLNNHSLRKLGDSLVQVEKWQLALEVHLKCGFHTTGVMAAHGLSCLRAGCFETAREKFSHCMQKLSNENDNAIIFKCITASRKNSDNAELPDFHSEMDIPTVKRPNRSPPLLLEIIKIIESIPYCKPQPETLARASIIRNSNTSLASLLSRRKENVPMHEPALNVLTTLANLKRLSKGHYYNENVTQSLDNRKHLQRQSRVFEECLHYVLTYGSHADVIQFLIRHQELSTALKYFIVQNLDAELFIQNIFLGYLRCGEVQQLIDQMLEIDCRLLIWNDTLIQTCRYLEKKNLLNSLYQLQILLKDPIRASMTCVKFYSMKCETFQQLHDNSIHLHNAHKHLQSELELSQWENVTLNGRGSRRQSTSTTASQLPFLMQMDARALNGHINTILRQLDVTKFLAKCEGEQAHRRQQQQQDQNSENDNRSTTEIVLKQIRIDGATNSLPSLFDSIQEKIQICILLLVCGKNIDEGFGLAYRIIQDYKLPAMKVFGATAKYLARNNRLGEVEKLLSCITSNNGTNNREIDELLSIAINSACGNHKPEVKSALDNLVKKIHSVELRISCHIFIGQLKSAYLLANKYERLADIRKILRQAEASNQIHIKKLCEKKLNMNQQQQQQQQQQE